MKKRLLSFGTDGIRGNADVYPFTPYALKKIGGALAAWLKHHDAQTPHLLIGHDTRSSCTRIKRSLVKSLTAHGVQVTDAGVIPTPALYQLLRDSDSFTASLVISASHNAYTDNGLKLFSRKTGKLTPEDEQIITDAFARPPHNPAQPPAAYTTWHEAQATYLQRLLSHFPEDICAGKRIVLDCAHGATYRCAPQIFKHLGANVIPLHVHPDGRNINDHAGAVHPQTLQRLVVQSRADIGFAFDGDGDRVVAVDAHGHLLDGDDLLYILLDHPAYKKQTTLVGTVMTNLGLEQALKQLGKRLTRVKVGDKYIATELEKRNLLVGGETSGHIILRDYLPTGDGIFAALRLIETVRKHDQLHRFEKCPQVLINLPVEEKKDLSQRLYASQIEAHKKRLINGRMIVRYSGTENLLRIMTEDSTQASARAVAQSLADKLRTLLTQGPSHETA